MNKNNNLEMFTKMPVHKAVLKNVLPAMAAMLFVLIYNLADTFFIGQTHDAILVAAVSLSTPVFLIFMAVGTIFGMGGTSVISRAVGEGRMDHAKKVCSFCMWGCVITGIVMALLFLFLMDQILLWMGASSDTIGPARTYLTIVTFSGPFVLITNCFSNVLRAEGQSTKAVTGQMAGNVLNIILDPIMILGFGWNIAGAAVATAIGNIVAALYYIFYYVSGKSVLSIRLKDFSTGNGILSGVLAIGIPASLGSILMSVSQILVNSMMANYGDMAVAGIGVAMKVTMISSMLAIGLGQGTQALIGYCVGAKLWERFKEILKYSVVLALGICLVLTAVCYLFTGQIVEAFLTDAQAYEYGVQFARILLTTGFLFGAFYVLTNTLQAMGAATPALIVNVSRQGIIYIPILYILRFTVNTAVGLVWAQPIADVLSIILVVFFFRRTLKKMRSAE